MIKRKKIISILLKSAVGLGSVLIIWYRLKSDFTAEKLNILSDSVFSLSGALCVLFCLLFIPLNWGLESWKWMLITAPIEKIDIVNAQKSVYSGLCVGNLAPGRATEFLGKIIFFLPENRANISVLHFVNGMFQLSVTYLLGFVALSFKLKSFGDKYMWVAWVTAGVACLIIAIFVLSIVKIDKVLHYVTTKIAKDGHRQFHYKFNGKLLFQLFSLSFVRYFVFLLQMLLQINLFYSAAFTFPIIISVVLYFLITTTIPMISVLEPAIRAAVALVVFSDTGLSNTAMALASVSVWLINIIIPSIAGYVFLLEQNFDFSFRKADK